MNPLSKTNDSCTPLSSSQTRAQSSFVAGRFGCFAVIFHTWAFPNPEQLSNQIKLASSHCSGTKSNQSSNKGEALTLKGHKKEMAKLRKTRIKWYHQRAYTGTSSELQVCDNILVYLLDTYFCVDPKISISNTGQKSHPGFCHHLSLRKSL